MSVCKLQNNLTTAISVQLMWKYVRDQPAIILDKQYASCMLACSYTNHLKHCSFIIDGVLYIAGADPEGGYRVGRHMHSIILY